jgi:hypothetical protein
VLVRRRLSRIPRRDFYAFLDHNAVLAWVAKALILPALLCLALAVLRLIAGAYAGRKYRAQGKD